MNGQAKEVSAARRRELTILHTSDLQACGGARFWSCAVAANPRRLRRLGDAVEAVRREVGGDRVLLLDAGDATGRCGVEASGGIESLCEDVRALRYDAMTAGRGTSVLAANLREGPHGRRIGRPYLVRRVQGIGVGIIGLASGEGREGKPHVEDACHVVRRLLPRLRVEGAQVIVVLSHLGLDSDERLAEQVGGIDVIVGGSAHGRLSRTDRVGRTVIAHAGARGADLGRLDLAIEAGQVTAHWPARVNLGNAGIGGGQWAIAPGLLMQSTGGHEELLS